MLPSFYIIGERKCGTSSLFRYICNHPEVVPGRLKEPNFFVHSEAYIRENWAKYLNNFPDFDADSHTLTWPELDSKGNLFEEEIHFTVSRHMITGESSANTLVDVSPRKLMSFLPNIKLIVILRDPVPRAFSHYKMFHRFKMEGRPLGFELLPFSEMVQWEIDQINKGKKTPTIFPGLYYQNLKPWIDTFGREAIYIAFLEKLIEHPWKIMQEIFEHLGISSFVQEHYDRYNIAPPSEIPKRELEFLKRYYLAHNKRLFQYLEMDNLWNYKAENYGEAKDFTNK